MDERNPFASLKKVCCYCNNACSGAHQCRKCSKPCHAIAPCSFSTDDDEGFGAKVTCCNCWLSDDDDDVVMDQNANVVGTNEVTNNDHDDDAFEQFANSQITAEDNDNIDSPASSSTRKRRGYTIEEKIRILDCAKTSSIHAASRRFSLDRNTIRGWKKQEAALRKMHQLAKRKRLIGGGRKLTNAQFDQELIIHGNSSISSSMYSNSFTTTITLLFMPAMKAVWLDPSDGTCITDKGAKTVTVLNTGHEKARVTVILTARSDGKKLQPFVLLPKKRPIPNIINRFKSRLHLCWCGPSAWESIPKPLIENSFLTCGITKEIDGRHDERIHVFKKEGAIPNGLALLKQRRKEDAVIKGVEEIDLGEDESDASVDI